MKLLFLLAAVVLSVAAQSGGVCDLCKSFVDAIKDQVHDHGQDIEIAANKTCDAVTLGFGPLNEMCHKYVATNIHKIVEGIENGDEPEKVCKDIELC